MPLYDITDAFRRSHRLFPCYKVLAGRELKQHRPEVMTVNPALVIQYCIIRIHRKDLTGGR